MGEIKISEAPASLRKYFEFADRVVLTECHKQWRKRNPERTEGLEAGNGLLDTYDEAQVAAREIRKAVNSGELTNAELLLFRQIVCGLDISPAECRQSEELDHLKRSAHCNGLKDAESGINDVRDLIEVDAYRNTICKLIEKRPDIAPSLIYSFFYGDDSTVRKAAVSELVSKGNYDGLIKDASAMLSTELFNRSFGPDIDRKIWDLINDSRFTNFGWTLNVELYGDHCLKGKAKAVSATVNTKKIARSMINDEMTGNCTEVFKALSWKDAAILLEHIGRPDHLSEWMVRGNYITGAGELAGVLLSEDIRSALRLDDMIFKKIASEKLSIAPHTEYAHLKALRGLSGIKFEKWREAPLNLIVFLADNIYNDFNMKDSDHPNKTIGELCKDLLGMVGKKASPLVRERLDLKSNGGRKDTTIELINSLGIASPNADREVILFLTNNIEDFRAQNAIRSIGKKAIKELAVVASDIGSYRSDIAKELILEINKAKQ